MRRSNESRRKAVDALSQAFEGLVVHSILPMGLPPAELRLAAVRLVLRLVFCNVAERESLLPVDNPIYRRSYALRALTQQLELGAAGAAGNRMGWARLVASWRLIFQGCAHPALPMIPYGGELFRPGNETGSHIEQILALWETPGVGPDDVALLNALHQIDMAVETFNRTPLEPGSDMLGRFYERLLEFELEEDVRDDGTSAWAIRSDKVRRKRQGSFFSPPWIADRIVEETLSPLVHEDGVLRPAQAISSLRILDPAMGSGTFLVSALRFLSGKMMESLLQAGEVNVLAGGQSEIPLEGQDPWILPVTPGDPRFSAILDARVRRHLVERCICGIDIDPVAVEVARFALWLETLDSSLPFSFLDHRLKQGNTLVGCGLRQSLIYPRQALASGRVLHSKSLVEADGALKQIVLEWTQPLLPLSGLPRPAVALRESRNLMSSLMEIPSQFPDRKAALYERIQRNPEMEALRQRLNSWTSLWFWPAEEARKLPGPTDYYLGDFSAGDVVERVARDLCPLHPELEFPDVFGAEEPGFDAVVGNPPWEKLSPQSAGLGPSGNHPKGWERMSNFLLHAGQPAGTGRTAQQLEAIAGIPRPGDVAYRLQGAGEANLYKLFLERSLSLLNGTGRLGMLLPGSLLGDRSSRPLREYLLKQGGWESVLSVQPGRRIFDIDPRFRFVAVVARPGRSSSGLRLEVMSPRSGEASTSMEPHRIQLRIDEVERLSPSSLAIPDVRTPSQLSLLQKLLRNHQSLESLAEKVEIRYRRELDLTVHRPLLVEHQAADETTGRLGWMDSGRFPDQEHSLPVLQGAMIHQFRFGNRDWCSESGRWVSPATPGRLVPRYTIPSTRRTPTPEGHVMLKLVQRRIARNTDERSLITTLVPDLPCTDKTPCLVTRHVEALLELTAVLNSFVCDWVSRMLNNGANIDRHLLFRLPVPEFHDPVTAEWVQVAVLRLTCTHPLFDPVWNWAAGRYPVLATRPGREWWVVDEKARISLRARLDALVALAYGLSLQDFRTVLDGCDLQAQQLKERLDWGQLDPRGFFRSDAGIPLEQRQAVKSLQVFQQLQSGGAVVEPHSIPCPANL